MRTVYHVIFLFFCTISCVYADLADTIPQIKSAVVGVGTINPTRSPKSLFAGTGFVVADGQHIITNAHVLPEKLDTEKNEQLAVFLPSSGNSIKGYLATSVAIDREHDIALLKIRGVRLPALQLGGKDLVREGERYAFTGFPIGMILGLTPVTHVGIISAITPIVIPAQNSRSLNAELIHRQRAPYKVYQLDATAYPGNSGSPLYDIKSGRVVAVINKVFVKETKESVLKDPSGITYAVPVEYVKGLLKKAKLSY